MNRIRAFVKLKCKAASLVSSGLSVLFFNGLQLRFSEYCVNKPAVRESVLTRAPRKR
jgi:hypothetical protein